MRSHSDLQTQFSIAVSLHQSGNLDGAIAIYKRLMMTDPSSHSILALMGACIAQKGEWYYSLCWLERALKIEANHPVTLTNYAGALLDGGLPERAGVALNRAICIDPQFPDSYRNHGKMLGQMQQWNHSRDEYYRAVRLSPRNAEFYSCIGCALVVLEDFEAALGMHNKAIALNPQSAEAEINRGSCLKELHRLDEALIGFNRAIALNRGLAEAYVGRGSILDASENQGQAIESYRRAISLQPSSAEVYTACGVALYKSQVYEESIQSHQRAIHLNEALESAHSNIGLVFHELRNYEAARASYQQALEINREAAEAYVNLGNTLKSVNQFDLSRTCFDRAILLRPNLPEAYHNRADVLQDLERPEEALVNLDRAIVIRPDFVGALWNRSLLRLLLGHYQKGWLDYEVRFQTKFQKNTRRGNLDQVPYNVSSMLGKRILIYPEQGFGDILQFCRYAPLLIEAGVIVTIESREGLHELLGSLHPDIKIVENVSSQDDEYDFLIPIMSLPLIFGTEVSTIPNGVPYLFASENAKKFWQERLKNFQRPKIGLVWSGGFRPNQPETWSINERRNIRLSELQRLKEIDAVFISLQKGDHGVDQLRELESRGWDGPEILDFTSSLNSFDDTAGLIDGLDLVVAVDTSTAHLAAALGKPVWILNRFDTCWRWFLNRHDSPWYPTATIYRQSNTRCWDSVVNRLVMDMKFLFG